MAAAIASPPQAPAPALVQPGPRPRGLWRVLTATDQQDAWSVLIGGAAGRGETLLQFTEQLIRETKVPDTHLERKSIAPGLVRGLMGQRRDFLVVTQRGNWRLRPYQMFLGARDYGVSLDVYWYLMHRPSLLQRLFALLLWIPGVNLLFLPILLMRMMGGHRVDEKGTVNLDIFDESDLRAYATNAHHCMLEAVDKLMLMLNQDPSKIERKSRGFLGIS